MCGGRTRTTITKINATIIAPEHADESSDGKVVSGRGI